jgi:hypothetical protein
MDKREVGGSSPGVITQCFLAYALLGLSFPGVVRLVTRDHHTGCHPTGCVLAHNITKK